MGERMGRKNAQGTRGVNRAGRGKRANKGTDLIFLERQLSQARWVFVRFLLSTRAAAEAEPTRWMSVLESAPSSSDALLFTPSWAYFLFRLPVAGGGAEEEPAPASGCPPGGAWYMCIIGPAAGYCA